MELGFPRYVRYDFFITLISIGLIVFWFYFTYITPISIDISPVLLIAIPLFIYGLSQMQKNYSASLELFEMENFVRRQEAIEKLEKFDTINKAETAALNYFLREDILNLISRKKEDKKQNNSSKD